MIPLLSYADPPKEDSLANLDFIDLRLENVKELLSSQQLVESFCDLIQLIEYHPIDRYNILL